MRIYPSTIKYSSFKKDEKGKLKCNRKFLESLSDQDKKPSICPKTISLSPEKSKSRKKSATDVTLISSNNGPANGYL